MSTLLDPNCWRVKPPRIAEAEIEPGHPAELAVDLAAAGDARE
jgi:hypothetical protein